ncbi:hypothetical protein CMK12_15330 [Candidatus Poribacteria bacterium]|nr:hypothetical protein [Candidatus Poribacteria bacterium]
MGKEGLKNLLVSLARFTTDGRKALSKRQMAVIRYNLPGLIPLNGRMVQDLSVFVNDGIQRRD